MTLRLVVAGNVRIGVFGTGIDLRCRFLTMKWSDRTAQGFSWVRRLVKGALKVAPDWFGALVE